MAEAASDLLREYYNISTVVIADGVEVEKPLSTAEISKILFVNPIERSTNADAGLFCAKKTNYLKIFHLLLLRTVAESRWQNNLLGRIHFFKV